MAAKQVISAIVTRVRGSGIGKKYLRYFGSEAEKAKSLSAYARILAGKTGVKTAISPGAKAAKAAKAATKTVSQPAFKGKATVGKLSAAQADMKLARARMNANTTPETLSIFKKAAAKSKALSLALRGSKQKI